MYVGSLRQSHNVAQYDLEFEILLPHSLKHLDYRPAPLHPAFKMIVRKDSKYSLSSDLAEDIVKDT